MASISSGDLATIAGENQRLVDVAKNLLALSSQVQDPTVSTLLQNQVEAVIGAAKRIGTALSGVR